MRHYSGDWPFSETEKDTSGKQAADDGNGVNEAVTQGGGKKVTKSSLGEISCSKLKVYILQGLWDVFGIERKEVKCFVLFFLLVPK